MELVRRVVEARLRPVLDEVPGGEALGELYPFSEEQIANIARTEPTLRDMLQQFRHLFDHRIYGPDDAHVIPVPVATSDMEEPVTENRLSALLGNDPAEDVPLTEFHVKQIDVIDSTPEGLTATELPTIDPTLLQELQPTVARKATLLTSDSLIELWEQEFRAAKRRLEPEGALTGATRELQNAFAGRKVHRRPKSAVTLAQ